MPVLETPSRVWRRIQEADDLAVPSLPSLPAIDSLDEDDDDDNDQVASKLFESARNTSLSTKKSTTVRFADKHESFEFSDILPITHQSLLTDEDDGDKLPADYSIALNPHISSFSKDLDKNVAQRRIRTPSLTRSASLASTSPDATPTKDEHLSLPNASRRSLTQPLAEDVSAETREDSSRQSPSVSRSKSQSKSDSTQSLHHQQSHHLAPQTPQTAKRSFMLDVIHSTAKPRPRLSMRTPGPGLGQQSLHTPFRTPKTAGNDSFISTASSHDLTVHQPRINASFDHLTGAKGVGRFNATKLNTYLHGLNRRLVEENEELTKRLESQRGLTSTILEADESTRAMEIVALEDMVRTLEAEVKKEKEEREKEKADFKERVKEVEDGVEDVVEKLERELETLGEAKEQALIKVRRAQELKEDAEERANRAEIALAKMTRSGISPRRSIGSPAGSGTASADEDFKEALERVVELEAELRIASQRCQGLEEELKSADEALDELRAEKQAGDRKLHSVIKQLEKSQAEAEGQESRIQELEEDLQDSRASMESLMLELGEAQEDAASAKEELEGVRTELEVLRTNAVTLETRCERLETDAEQMEAALEASEEHMMHDREEIAALRGELERLRLVVSTGPSAFSSNRASTNTAVSLREQSASGLPVTQEEIEALEKELDDAHREIGRLQHLLQDSPTRAALSQVKDSKIDALERENAELEDKVRALRVLLSKGPMPGSSSLLAPVTPARSLALGLGASPAVRPLPSFRGPKTPGEPLKDVSWLQSGQQLDESDYLHQISLLERELAHANENVDDKIDKLEEYGRGVVGLTDKLADAETRITFLDDEVKRLERREERRVRKARKGVTCGGCGGTVELMTVFGMGDQTSLDISHVTISDVAASESMRTVLDKLRKMKQDWEHEKRRLEDEREYLQGAADRLNREVDLAKQENDDTRGVVSELDQARRAIADFEVQLQMERDRLRAITNERNRTVNEKKQILSNLERTQADMENVKEQLRKCKQENYALEGDLRSNAVAETKSRHLQAKAAQNQALIDQLRQERDQLAESHAALQKRYSSASERVDDLRKTLKETQSGHDERRHQLDMQIADINDLKRELAWRDEELARERRKGDNSGDLAAVVQALEKEIRRIRTDAENFARDMASLRENNEDLELRRNDDALRAERVQMQLRTQVRLLEEQLEGQRVRSRQLVEELDGHVCAIGDSAALASLKSQHNKECKGLMVQITYLKSKFMRESVFRQELAYQKRYLLLVLSKLRNSDVSILAAIAQSSDLSISGPMSPKPSIKRVAHIVMFLNRAKKATKQWAEHNDTKEQIAVALQDVRRRRAANGGRKSAPGLVGS
ncbi:hypothetical protein M408DRAFT_325604 [Serendipita vermifera MAFF 305830]|uniref:Pericentrin/AKAP-450 centrosomal targeting domain-containing protein n=1 Tax=Serendipita vermifera MAFF 305830 TaxID=933852 RepID=A0A0C3BRT4_SERVB|nr:hypothetical protein M408DRAFT_325604 [Serendipita vermifera MAFF 305830]